MCANTIDACNLQPAVLTCVKQLLVAAKESKHKHYSAAHLQLEGRYAQAHMSHVHCKHVKCTPHQSMQTAQSQTTLHICQCAALKSNRQDVTPSQISPLRSPKPPGQTLQNRRANKALSSSGNHGQASAVPVPNNCTAQLNALAGKAKYAVAASTYWRVLHNDTGLATLPYNRSNQTQNKASQINSFAGMVVL